VSIRYPTDSFADVFSEIRFKSSQNDPFSLSHNLVITLYHSLVGGQEPLT
jgi:hypothetical protein